MPGVPERSDAAYKNTSRNIQENTLAFSLITAADTGHGAKLYGLRGLDAEDAARAMQQIRLQHTGDVQPPPHLREIKHIAVAGHVHGKFFISHLDDSQGESSLLADFYRRSADAHTTLLGYDLRDTLAVLRCRALINKTSVLANGSNSELGRDPQDLAQPLTASAEAPVLEELLSLMGLPAADAKASEADGCLQRAVQIYLLHLRQRQLNEGLHSAKAEQEIRSYLVDQSKRDSESLWRLFLDNWPQ